MFRTLRDDEKTSWYKLISEELEEQSETWDSVVAHTFKGDEMARLFDDGYGGSEGVPFTLWTVSRVYFPVVYDGAEWVKSVPRNPCAEATAHVGGE
jgi:hypothetical protein